MLWSLPSRERGLKLFGRYGNRSSIGVAPLAGAWIEINILVAFIVSNIVAPLAGAWIEISRSEKEICPLRVAPLAGAWIEIYFIGAFIAARGRRSPRGSVD